MPNHLTSGDYGAANGVPELDADGLMMTQYLPQVVQDFLDAGVPDPILPWLILPPWEFKTSDLSLANGVQGQYIWIPPGFQFGAVGPLMKVDDFGTTDLVVDFQLNVPPSYSGGATIYAGTKPKIPLGSYSAFGGAPTTSVGAPGCYIRPVLISVPSPQIPNASPAAVVGTPGTLVESNNTHTFTVPTGGVITDTVLIIAHMPGPTATMSVPADWTLLATNASSAAVPPRSRLYVFVAQWKSSLVATLNESSSSPFNGVILRISHSDIGSILVDQAAYSPGDGVGSATAVATAAISSAAAASDLSLLIVGVQYQSSTADGYTIVVNSGGPTGQSVLANVVTSRGPTQNDIGLLVVKGDGVAAAGAIAAASISATGGTGGLLSTTTNSLLLTLRRAPTQHGPSNLTVQISVQQTTA